ncbi:hypothetical protein [Arthrobacter oryzae]|uniref:Integral membrane protein n=1 Tax=Arthrobacter oryzae TaxID=409290 RepID=A0A3N0BZN1_9MICC|nr:hypothetical protein [Arthrobacter oryzae]RNL55352.1 hypothetical protein D7003_10345 [Arthrobacter oryzae]
MRTFVSAAAVLIGLVLAAVAVPAMWADRNVVQEGGFVALTAPLGKDPAFQKRLAAATVDTLMSGDLIPDYLMALARPVLETAADSLTGLPDYPSAWAETVRKSHRLSFADPGTLPPEADATTLTLDIGPLVGLLAKQVADSTKLPVEAPDQVLIDVGEPTQRQVIERVSAFAPMGYAVTAAAGIAFAIALVAARRRWSVLAGTGAGALVLAGLWKLAADAAAGAAIATSSAEKVAGTFTKEFAAAATASFEQWILVAAVAGAALLVIGLIARSVGARRRVSGGA